MEDGERVGMTPLADSRRGESAAWTEGLEALICRFALTRMPAVALAVVLPSGAEVALHPGPIRYRIHLRTRTCFARFVSGGSAAFGDLYRDGLLTVDGDLVSLLVEANRMAEPTADRRTVLSRLSARWRRVDGRRAARNARQHYAHSSEFFGAWLDADRTYTCAWFPHDGMTLAEAQAAKMELICRKLRLGRGESVVEAGCGWGALALYMARHYDARVRAFNVSGEQVAWARERAKAEGLDRRVEFVVADYRDIEGCADAFVSVGMLEHVGPRHYRQFGAVVSRVIGERGRALVHTIGRVRPMPTDRWIERRVFPDGYTPSPAEISRAFEPNDLAVLHMENLRADYALTLAHWLRNFDAAVAGPLAGYDPKFLRTWRLYLAASQAAFLTGWAQLYQFLLTSRANTSFRGPHSVLAMPGPAGPEAEVVGRATSVGDRGLQR